MVKRLVVTYPDNTINSKTFTAYGANEKAAEKITSDPLPSDVARIYQWSSNIFNKVPRELLSK